MKSVIYAAILLAVCVAQASALKCYTCEDCQLSGFLAIVENSQECSVFQSSCRKTVDQSGAVSRGCATVVECAATDVFGRCNSGSDTGCQVCCSSDNCNGAVATKASFMGLALALATAVSSKYL